MSLLILLSISCTPAAIVFCSVFLGNKKPVRRIPISTPLFSPEYKSPQKPGRFLRPVLWGKN